MFLSDGVERHEVRYKNLRGYLFLPKCSPGTKVPAVIDIFGGAWGLVAHRAAMLARHGYAALSVAYAAFDDLPKQLSEFDMSYFAEAYEFLAQHECVDGERVGVTGSCLGGTLALAMSREVPKIKAVAVVSPEPIAGQWNYRFLNGEIVEGCSWDPKKVDIDGTMYTVISQKEKALDVDNAWEKHSLQYGKIKAPILCFYGSNDQLFDLRMAIPALRKQFSDENKENYEIVVYKHGGHIIQPCYLPMFSRYYSPIFGTAFFQAFVL